MLSRRLCAEISAIEHGVGSIIFYRSITSIKFRSISKICGLFYKNRFLTEKIGLLEICVLTDKYCLKKSRGDKSRRGKQALVETSAVINRFEGEIAPFLLFHARKKCPNNLREKYLPISTYS